MALLGVPLEPVTVRAFLRAGSSACAVELLVGAMIVQVQQSWMMPNAGRRYGELSSESERAEQVVPTSQRGQTKIGSATFFVARPNRNPLHYSIPHRPSQKHVGLTTSVLLQHFKPKICQDTSDLQHGASVHPVTLGTVSPDSCLVPAIRVVTNRHGSSVLE